MSFKELQRICNIICPDERQTEFIEFYKERELNGLYYVNFYNDSQAISISCPNHITHHEATTYLINMRYSSKSMNTALNHAQYIKKFLDFLLIWNIDDIMQTDLLILLIAFVEYLTYLRLPNPKYKSIQWSTVTKVPLHDRALYTNIVSIGQTAEGFMQQTNWSDLSYVTISQTLSGAIDYLMFLAERTNRYSKLKTKLKELPHTVKTITTELSGTLGPTKILKIDTNSILNLAGLRPTKSKAIISLELKIFTEDQCKEFTNAIPSKNHQDKLLFYILEHFGLRRSEVANLQIDTSTIPDNILFKTDTVLEEELKENLKGDIWYCKETQRWNLSVIERDIDDINSQLKTGSRVIPHDYDNSYFVSLLIKALKHRVILERKSKERNYFLFISQQNGNIGKKISGKAVYDKFTRIVNKLYNSSGVDLQNFTPHSFRHYFATYQIRVRNRSLEDVSNWLGHSTVEITRQTYLHYIPTEYRDVNIVEKMKDTIELNTSNTLTY